MNMEQKPPSVPDDRFKVLVIDSNLRSQRNIQRILSSDPGIYVVGTHKRGRSALQFLRSNHVDAVFMNPELNDLNGFDLFSYLQDPPLVVVVSDRYDYGFFAFQIGAIDFINTDFTYTEFRACLANIRLEYDRRRVYKEYLAEQDGQGKEESKEEK